MTHLVGFIGPPSSGKTLLCGAMKEYMIKKAGLTCDICTEYAREYVYKYGIPDDIPSQYRITLEQETRENLLCSGDNSFVFTDSPVWLAYVYTIVRAKKHNLRDARSLDIISHIYSRFVMHEPDRYKKVFYLRGSSGTMDDDGCRDVAENDIVAETVDGFVQIHSGVLPIEIIDVPLKDSSARKKKVLDTIWSGISDSIS